MNYNLPFSILFLLLFSNVFCQKSDEFYTYKTKYPNENLVEINCENIIDIDIKSNKLIISDNRFSKKIHLTQSAKYQSKQKIYSSDFFSLDKINATSYNYINGDYKEFKVKKFNEKDETSGSTFYDDLKSVNFYYSGLEIGSKTQLRYEKSIKNPRFLGAYFIGDFYPIENYKLKIITNKNVALEFKTMYMDSVDISFQKKEKGNKNIYEWILKDLKSYPNESNSKGYKYIIPQIIPLINYYHINGDTTFILNSTKDLYQWYQLLTSDLNKEPCDKDLKSLVDSITSSCNTNLEKVKSIYYWTQKNIKYIAFEDGLGGFIPRNANEVYQKKYGDCKDNSSILKQMLKEAGIEGHLTWIGTRSLPYKYDDVYSPIVDNHMILTYFENEKPYFLDATGRYHNINIPTSFIQGKEALVAIDKENYKIVEVPIPNSEINSISDSIEIYLEKNTIKGKGFIRYDGYEKINLFYDIESLKAQNDYTDYFKNKLELGNNNFLLDSIYDHNKYDYDNEYKVAYSFTINNYCNEIGDKIYINLNLNQKDVETLKFKPLYKTDIDYTHKYKGSYYYKFNLPNNYEIESIPKDFEIKNDLIEINITYKIEDGSINYYHSIKTKFITLTIKQQKLLVKTFEEIQKKFKEVVVLKLKPQ